MKLSMSITPRQFIFCAWRSYCIEAYQYVDYFNLRQHRTKLARYGNGWKNGSMKKQMTLSAFTDELANTATKKKEFLAQIDRIIPWSEWIGMIQPHYYKGERGNKPYELELIPPNY